MANTTENLRRPISAVINGQPCVMLTIGHLAHAVGRSNWTVLHWTRLGLLPAAPFVLRPDIPNTRRRLYPASFVIRMAEITRDYSSNRLERDQWDTFRDDVQKAFQETVVPLLRESVTEEVP